MKIILFNGSLKFNESIMPLNHIKGPLAQY